MVFVESFGVQKVLGVVFEVIKNDAMDSCVPERFIALLAESCFAMPEAVNALLTEDWLSSLDFGARCGDRLELVLNKVVFGFEEAHGVAGACEASKDS